MTAAPDYLGALRTAVGLDAGLQAASGGRIYIGELPQGEAEAQPRAAILLKPAGGAPELGAAQLTRPRVDTMVYGRTPNESWRLSLQLHAFLKEVQRRVAVASSTGERALIHDVTPAAGPIPLRDPAGDWPMTLRTYSLLVAEVAAP